MQPRIPRHDGVIVGQPTELRLSAVRPSGFGVRRHGRRPAEVEICAHEVVEAHSRRPALRMPRPPNLGVPVRLFDARRKFPPVSLATSRKPPSAKNLDETGVPPPGTSASAEVFMRAETSSNA